MGVLTLIQMAGQYSDHDNKSSQWLDSDGDGYGDEFSGFQGDECKLVFGNSTVDRFGCPDSDGDGYSNNGDTFPNNPTQYQDSDGDGYGNPVCNATQVDAFPSDGTQWNDTDGDGHGDSKYGSQGDHFPNNPSRWQDSDEDGYTNEDDADNDTANGTTQMVMDMVIIKMAATLTSSPTIRQNGTIQMEMASGTSLTFWLMEVNPLMLTTTLEMSKQYQRRPVRKRLVALE